MLLTRFLASALPTSLLALCLSLSASAAEVPAPAPIQSATDVEKVANTEPSDRSEQRLKLGGVIDEVLVKCGDKVKAGQLLMRLDVRVEQTEADMYKDLVAHSDVDINAAETKHKQARNEFARLDDLFKNGQVASVVEWEKSKLDVELTALEITKAQNEKKKNEDQYKRALAVLQAMELRAKFDGIVERIDAKAGEVIDFQKPAITIVNNHPLWIQFTPKSAVSLTLKIDQELDVYYTDDPKLRKAKIIFISPVVKADSDRQVVRLEMLNPEAKPSGLQVRVVLPSKIAQVETKAQ
ncbi:MAG: efflux RND transporter periplasmic adaptor subunit [Planctomycetota bacterium]|nr:efflux RND transporter periplasmic adaptor subunit [Planctomycetota bacterium]